LAFPYWTLIIFIVPILILISAVYLVEYSYEESKNHEILMVADKLFFQKQKIESDFTLMIKAQNGFTHQQEWKSLDQLDLFDSMMGGIPENAESEKRNIARYLINEFGFQSFGITTVDGRMYLLEPFEAQLSLSKHNFADREWFQGVLNSKDVFISDVFISAASNHPVIVISAPLFSEDDSLIGMWGGGIDLEFLTSYLNEFQKKSMSTILIDNNNQVIADTRDSDYHGKAFDYLLRSESNKNNYSFDIDSDMHVFHTTIKLKNKEWNLFTVIPDSDFLSSTKQEKIEAYYLIGLMQAFLLVIAIFVFRNIRKNYKLTQNLQENQEKLIKKERLSAIGELSARIAHDIKNPLSNIKISKDILEMKVLDASLKPYFKKMDKNIFRISHQIDDVLDFLKKNPIKKSEINIRSLVENSISNMFIPKNISIDVKECAFKVNVDPIKMERVFSNLILNAIQEIGSESGKITISFEDKHDQCIITIEDSGKGINPEIVDKIFEPLFTTKFTGTGLGLATVKNIIDLHNGKIKLQTNPTRFVLTIPKY
jgi:signal transduction histidine kinase